MADINLDLISWQTLVVAFIGGLLPALIWLWFWLKEDAVRPEPKRLIARTFIAGAASVLIAIAFERLLARSFGTFQPLSYRLDLSFSSLSFIAKELPLFILFAVIEESIKLLAVYAAAFREKDFDEPIDAMIYMITAAVGFAAMENALFLLHSLYQGESGALFLLTGNLRFLGASVLHIVSSAVLGGILALFFCAKSTTRIAATIFGLITATVLHALFNFFIILNEGRGIFQVFLALWLACVFVIWYFEKIKTIVCQADFKKPLF